MKIILSLMVGLLGCSGNGTDSGLFSDAGTSSSSNGGGGSSNSSSTVTSSSSVSTTGMTASSASSSSGMGGAASSSSSSMCVPNSCLDLGKNCGVIDDNGCGHKLDCGSCMGDYQACGDAQGPQGAGMGTPNVCGGGCTQTQITGGICGNQSSWAIWGCNQAGYTAPLNTPGSYPTDLAGQGPLPSQYWCVPTGN